MMMAISQKGERKRGDFAGIQRGRSPDPGNLTAKDGNQRMASEGTDKRLIVITKVQRSEKPTRLNLRALTIQTTRSKGRWTSKRS